MIEAIKNVFKKQQRKKPVKIDEAKLKIMNAYLDQDIPIDLVADLTGVSVSTVYKYKKNIL